MAFNKLTTALAIGLMLLAGRLPAADQHLATILFATGDVQVYSTTGALRPEQGEGRLSAGDRLQVRSGKTQLRLANGSLVAVEPDSELALSATATGVLRLILVSGSVRAVVPDAVDGQLIIDSPAGTVTATAGSFTATIGNQGIELAVTSGQHQLCNSAGCNQFAAGQVGIADRGKPGVRQGRSSRKRFIATQLVRVTPPYFMVGETRGEEGTLAVLESGGSSGAGGSSAGGGSVLSGGDFAGGSGQSIAYAAGGTTSAFPGISPFIGIDLRDGITSTFDSGGKLTAYDVAGITESPTIGSNSFAEFGSDNLIALGRWSGGTTGGDYFGNQIDFAADDGFHYVVGTPAASLPPSGTINYSLLASTSPTLTDGSVTPGSFDGSLTIAYGATPQFALQLQPTVGGVTYTAATDGFPTPTANNLNFESTASFTISNMAVTTTGGAGVCAGSCSGMSRGIIVGTSAERVGLAYQILPPIGGGDTTRVSGAAVFASP